MSVIAGNSDRMKAWGARNIDKGVNLLLREMLSAQALGEPGQERDVQTDELPGRVLVADRSESFVSADRQVTEDEGCDSRCVFHL